jgi:hypothetical protein
LYSQAAREIGCQLKIVRMPKKRLHKRFVQGQIDFYPGTSFSVKRAAYLYYIENGLTTGQYGLTLASIANIENYQTIKKLGLTWIMELGSSKLETANSLGIKTINLPKITVDIAMRYINTGKAGFAIVDKGITAKYLSEKQMSSFNDISMKLHKNCCGGVRKMYMGFSKRSKHFTKQENPDYQPNQELGFANNPETTSKHSVAYRFGQALINIQEKSKTIADL